MLELHVSDSQIFRSCRRRWQLGSLTQMNLEPNRPITALWMGSAVHYGMESYYKDDVRDPDVAIEAVQRLVFGQIQQIRHDVPGLSGEEDDKLRAGAELAVGMMQHYVYWAQQWDIESNPYAASETMPIIKRVLATEQKFKMPLLIDSEEQSVLGHDGTVPISVEGKIDGIIEDQYDRLWILEHKTAAQDNARHHMLLDEQPGIYMVAAQHLLGRPITGVLYNLLRKKLPAVPEQLVRGGFTQRKNIDTTYEVYLGTLQNAGVDTAPYAEILASLKQKGNTFFHRVPVARSQNNLNNLMKRMKFVADDMVNSQIYASPNPMKCSMCPFEDVCLAMEDGADWRYIINANYRVRSKEFDPENVIAQYAEQYEESTTW